MTTPTDLIARAPRAKSRRHRAVLSPRNLAIFKKVEIEKFTHQEAAQRYQIDRSRVTQIVKRVRHQLAEASADDPEINDLQARQRLDKHLEKLRLEYALDAAAKALRRDSPRLVTNRAGSRHKGDTREGWSEVVTRDVVPNVQTIKTYLRVSQELGKLSADEADQPQEKPTLETLLRTVCEVLEDFFMRTQIDNDPPSREFVRFVDQSRAKIFTWVIRRQQGIPRADAWSPQDPPKTNNQLTIDSATAAAPTSDSATP